VCVAIEKERITRRKHDGYNDAAAIEYCLKAAGIKLKDLALIVQNSWWGMFERGNDWFDGPRLLDPAVPVATISHHLAHAYSAFATSPFRDACVMVIDNGGNSLDECMDMDGAAVPVSPEPELRGLYSEVDSCYFFDSKGFRAIFKDFSPPGFMRKPYPMFPIPVMHSIGGLYKAVSLYIFGNTDDVGKLMGLVPYGRPGVHDFPMFDLKNGRVFVSYEWQSQFNSPARNLEQFKSNFQYYADIAYWAQREIERAVLYLMENRLSTYPAKNLCYAGGVALNAVANRLVQERFGNVYIPPAAGDNGVSLGCAYYGWLKVLQRERVMHDGSIFFGTKYTDETIQSAVAESGAKRLIQLPRDYVVETAKALADGKIVGWFQNGAEFGPRALGNRSILADPRRPEVRDFINRHIKDREDFRPFAPSVLSEERELYFSCRYESPYMLMLVPVRSEWCALISSVVHCDSSARIQTVREAFNTTYYRLLVEFRKLTGIGVLLNTSFNKRGMPIVETPAQALDLFLRSAMDVLVMQSCFLDKSAPCGRAPSFSSEKKSTMSLPELRITPKSGRRDVFGS
jgi:carbamoyltransferase